MAGCVSWSFVCSWLVDKTENYSLTKLVMELGALTTSRDHFIFINNDVDFFFSTAVLRYTEIFACQAENLTFAGR